MISISQFGASGGSPREGAPTVSSSNHWLISRGLGDHEAAESADGRGAVVDRAAGGDRLTGRGLASRPEPTIFSAATRAGGPSIPGRRRAAREGHAYQLSRAGVERHVRAGAFSARSRAMACSASSRRVIAHRPSELVMVRPRGGPSSVPPGRAFRWPRPRWRAAAAARARPRSDGLAEVHRPRWLPRPPFRSGVWRRAAAG